MAAACSHSQPRTAPFHARPDSTKAGDLAGPFSGQVLDSASGDPVSGAVVYASWTYHAGTGAPQPTGFRQAIASTDANGRYKINAVHRLKRKNGDNQSVPEGRLTDFHLVIYKRGYVGYRSDRRFSDFGPRRDFAQTLNQVELARWNSTQSHVRHLRYIGGGGPLNALTDWERIPAGDELNGISKEGGMTSDLLASVTDDRIIAAQLLGETEIKNITKYDGSFESGPLNDEADTDTYSSQHFKALGQPEVFDVAVRLWRLGVEDGAATKRYEELLTTLPGVSELPTEKLPMQVSFRSMIAVEGDIQGIAFLDDKRGLVVLITCGKGQCSELSQLGKVAQQVYSNIEVVMPLGQTP